VINETIRDVGVHLDVNKIFLYTYHKKHDKAYVLRNYWDVSGEAPDDELLYTLPERMFMVEDGIKVGEGRFFVDNTNMTESSKLNLMRYNFKAVIAYPIYLNGNMYGMLFFAEAKAERVWTKEELRFSQSISLVIQSMLENAEGDDNVRNVNKHLIETYNNFDVGIFVKDAATGKVLFSNAKMNTMLGHDFTGGDSKSVLTDLHDRFDNITGMRRPFLTKQRVAKWKSYIQVLDDIMDITEIQIEWLKGEQASLIILRKPKDF
jgi:transcriptional regulator with GAF, ATPase, and Fis domain